MAFFNRKQNTEKKAAAMISAPAPSSSNSGTHSIAFVLRSPRITEKGTMAGGQSAYLFDVATSATKRSIAQAVFALYKVAPRMVRIVTIPAKRKKNSRTGRVGIQKGGKKAYVYLKKGETITIS